MLKQITIQDYAIVESLDIDLAGGMTVITGETGAGKSIMLDALGLCIGDRADARTVRTGARRADITAIFDVGALQPVMAWLAQRDLELPDNECILRRVIGADGRSKAFINGTPATLADCTAVGALLVDIHSQHAHQSLLRRGNQRALLDAAANADSLVVQVATLALDWQALSKKIEQATDQTQADTARLDLLRYQVAELNQLNLESGELQQLEAEQKQLHNADFIIDSAGEALSICTEQTDQLGRLQQLMADERHEGKAVANIREMLETAVIQLGEAQQELLGYSDRLERDPAQLQTVTNRLEQIYDLARKHRIMPEQLPEHQLQLNAELAALEADDIDLEQLQTELQACSEKYAAAAKKLSAKRTKAAKQLVAQVTATLKQLAMEHCTFEVVLTPHGDGRPEVTGAEAVEFMISTNPGSPPAALAKIASGGELSRISLALQVAAAERATAPTMIFDEVDVGIGGGIAEVVGDLLGQLSDRVQVLVVTHLAQVACKGNHHLLVSKTLADGGMSTGVDHLDDETRVEEIARMQGGRTITDNNRAHARELLDAS